VSVLADDSTKRDHDLTVRHPRDDVRADQKTSDQTRRQRENERERERKRKRRMMKKHGVWNAICAQISASGCEKEMKEEKLRRSCVPPLVCCTACSI
jgi:hypothetical protein